jgi:hypothetical protein
MKNTLLLIVILALSQNVFFKTQLSAQESKAPENPEIPKMAPLIDATYGMGINSGKPIFLGSLSFYNTHGLLKSKKLRLGYGLRFSGFGSSDGINYITAPFNLTKDPDKIDTLLVSNPLTMGLNVSLHIEYIIIPRLKIGFNIDAIGVGFGPQQKNNSFISSNNNGQHDMTPFAKPTILNALLIGDRDWGHLGSEFFAAYAINKKLWVRAGMNMTFSEFTTNTKLTFDNDRFRYKAMLIFVGISYNPFIK